MSAAPVPRMLRGLRAVRWYLRELTGEADYDRYLAHHRSTHPDGPAMSRREFDRLQWERRANTPGNRCC